MEDVIRKRLHWHSRRGMWELDLLLLPFLEQRYDALSDQDKAIYVDLLAEEDQDLFVWLMKRNPSGNPEYQRLIDMVIANAENAHRDQFKGL
ncbi:FAD assembly factor SdhE [Cobetia sp. L2A1]|uniref:FAD assembly factor SdhE n=1 Tax=Cobetia sp. L2A1 TaxID=2686360 RepID=UPI00131D8AC3|nr:succinate dehydrogenase assembly factor 2 [Cobetia sp. L2A1]